MSLNLSTTKSQAIYDFCESFFQAMDKYCTCSADLIEKMMDEDLSDSECLNQSASIDERYNSIIVPEFLDGPSRATSQSGSPTGSEGDYVFENYDFTEVKQSGGFWHVELENMRGPHRKGQIWRYKIREREDGSFRIVEQKWKCERADKHWIKIDL